MHSYASTALDYSANAADEGTLHETEYIAPQTRPDGPMASHPVCLTGYVFVREGCALNNWRDALAEIQVGGERKSGWGRLRLCDDISQLNPEATKLFGELECRTNNDRPQVIVQPERPLLSHTLINGTKSEGSLEPLTGRIWDEHKGAGQVLETVGVCYTPGSQLTEAQAQHFELTTDHLWRHIPNLV